MLDRVGGEVARATSIVSYAPDSKFSPHVHTGGEEFIVLEGVFQDEHGDFPAGSYIRNPPESKHTPGSESGCVIFVKLWQFDLQDRQQVSADMNQSKLIQDATREGVQATTLFSDERETVTHEQWTANSQVKIDASEGAEIFVLQGSFSESKDHLKAQSWMRLPIDASFTATTGESGAKVWVKTRHLQHVQGELDRLPV